MHRIHNITTTLQTDGANLEGSSLRSSNLSASEAIACRFERFRFDRCDMTHAEVNDVRLVGASFVDCDWTGATIDGVLVEDLLSVYRAFKRPSDMP